MNVYNIATSCNHYNHMDILPNNTSNLHVQNNKTLCSLPTFPHISTCVTLKVPKVQLHADSCFGLTGLCQCSAALGGPATSTEDLRHRGNKLKS